MTVYNCGSIYYTVCLLCLILFSFHCAKLTVPYRFVLLYLFLYVCVFFNLKLPSCYCLLFFLLKCLPYFRGNGTFRLNLLILPFTALHAHKIYQVSTVLQNPLK